MNEFKNTKKKRIFEDVDPMLLFERVVIIALFLQLFNVLILFTVFSIKNKTTEMIDHNLSLINEARESTKKLFAFVEERHPLDAPVDPQIERIHILLSEHDKKLKILQDTTNQLYEIQYSYSEQPIK